MNIKNENVFTYLIFKLLPVFGIQVSEVYTEKLALELLYYIYFFHINLFLYLK